MENINPSNLETVLRYLPDPAFVITRSGFYAAAFGGRDSRYYHDGSPLVGLYVHEFMEKSRADWLVDVVEGTLQSGRLEVIEYPLSGNDLAKLEAIGPTEVLWFEARIQALPFQMHGEDCVLWVASNITERHRLEEELKRLSNTDPLTGLFNRRHFETLVQDELRQMSECGRPVSIMIADLDHFKQINDTYGHSVGDRVLEDVATLITRNLRRADFAARWGGEEFVVTLSGGNAHQAVAVAERLRRSVESAEFVEELNVTLSIGVAECSLKDDSFMDVFERADAALYEAKRSGRNRVCYAGNDATVSPADKVAERLQAVAARR